MTIEEFARRKNVKKIETVIGWIQKGFIPGASLEKNYIPNSAREPYTKARAKNVKTIYWSIFNASKNLKHVTYQMYPTITEREFNSYLDELVSANLITRRIEDDVVYYDVPFEALRYTKKQVLEVIEIFTRSATEGITTAALAFQTMP